MDDIYKRMMVQSIDDAVDTIDDAERFEADPAAFALELFRFRCAKRDELFYEQRATNTMDPLPDGLDRDKQ